MKTFKQFINESIRDKIIGPSDDEILKHLETLNIFERIEKIKEKKLPERFLPTDEEIKKELNKEDDKVIYNDSYYDGDEYKLAMDKLLSMINSKYGDIKSYDGYDNYDIFKNVEYFFDRYLDGEKFKYVEINGLDFKVFKNKKVIFFLPDMGEEGAIIFDYKII